MPSRTYVAQRPGAFGGLVQARDLAGYQLEALPSVNIRDYYFDTEDAELLRQGMCLRVREQGGERRALLRGVRPDDPRLEIEATLDGPHTEVFDTPRGLLHEALESLVGGSAPGLVEPLHPLIRFRQYRTPRMAYDGTRLLGLLSFDVVVIELPEGPYATNELDIELSDAGHEADLYALDPLLREGGLVPVALTKFERGVMRLPRSLTEPLLLLPDEREALEILAESDQALHRRRARVLLLDARGFRSSTIANQVELSTARVRHWKQQFREQRMAIFEMQTRAPASDHHAYRVSEMMAGGAEAVAPVAISPDRVPPMDSAPRPKSARAEVPSEPQASGDGAPPMRPEIALPSGEVSDIEDLLALFQPGETTTPILHDPVDEDGVPEPDAEPHEASGDVAEPALTEPAATPDDRESVPGLRVEAPESASPPEVRPSPTVHSVARSAVSPIGLTAAETAPEASGDRPTARRPRIQPDDSILEAALQILSYHFGQLGWCAADLDRPRGPFRLLLAVHRVRLSLEVFEPILPRETVESLHRGLRRLAYGLNHTFDLERLIEDNPGDDAIELRRQRSLDSLRTVLQGHSFESWIGRAQRLVERLASQQRAGVETPDDAPHVWDDYVADPGVIPGRTRVRHLLGSALWQRIEALISWEKDGAAPEADVAYHLALACSGIRFVLGIAETTAPGPVRQADAILDRAEARLMSLHLSRETTPEAERQRELHETWAELRGPELRHAFAETLVAL
ncbi:CYTH domain-containing protein [Rubricoccus marinus]|uniref:CYTH domain-containing protein n=1 Tax=Rubricoccus marinus TaxID=716817 RepID=A0A259TYN9_9BACT|nr:CYTH domain-containing protein [Rubricoccus marinus]OZC02831.1 hypothetical protein BSZ36_07500 [Rubricoccus marinus]